MRGTRAILAAIALAAMTGQTMAATSLCVEDAATGFNWENGKWVQSNFITSTYVIRPLSESEKIGDLCRAVVSASIDKRQVCYVRHEVGETPTSGNVSQCTEYPLGSTETSVVRCDKGFAEYQFEPNGEFLLTRTMNTGGDDYRDSLAIAVGKCSVVAP